MARMTRIATQKTKAKSLAVETVGSVKDLRPRDADAQYYGSEPNFVTEQPTSLIEAFNWYSKFYSSKEAKDFLVDYLDRNNKIEIAKLVRKAPEGDINTSMGWLARMSVRGLKMEDRYKARLQLHIEKLVEIVKAADKAERKKTVSVGTEVQRKTIQEVMRERASQAAAEIDAFFDEYHANGYSKDFDTKSKVMVELQELNILPQHVPHLVANWEKIRAEYVELQTGTCDQLNEAYSFMSKMQVRNVIKFIDSIITDLNGYVAVKQVSRKPRARKAVPVEKIVAKLKYCKTFKDDALQLDLVSLSPVKLHNCTEAWVYDTKKRKMHHFVADTYSKSLGVKGNTLLGFDKKESGIKTLRKPAEQIKALTGSKPAARKYFKEIKAVEAVPNGRFNEDMIILKAF
jgi:hypothetical protein